MQNLGFKREFSVHCVFREINGEGFLFLMDTYS
jgi:hypothetical protein